MRGAVLDVTQGTRLYRLFRSENSEFDRKPMKFVKEVGTVGTWLVGHNIGKADVVFWTRCAAC